MTLDEALVDALRDDYRKADLSAADRVMLDYVDQLTRDATRIGPDDIQALRGQGFDDRTILQISALGSWFNYINRMADALGVGKDEMHEHAGMELHDSTVAVIEHLGADVVLRFSPGYVHRSAGRPGIDPGSGWVQDVEMRIVGAMIDDRPAELPCEIASGQVIVGSEVYRNLVPLLLDVSGAVEVSLTTIFGERLTIRGRGIAVDAVGSPAFVEEFPGVAEA